MKAKPVKPPELIVHIHELLTANHLPHIHGAFPKAALVSCGYSETSGEKVLQGRIIYRSFRSLLMTRGEYVKWARYTSFRDGRWKPFLA